MIEALVNVAAQLDRDAGADPHDLSARDRAVGQDLAALKPRPAQQLAAWANHVAEDREALPGARVTSALWVIALLLVGLGVVLGAAVAAAVFHYDGSRPVNVTRIIWLFVGGQALLLSLMLVAFLPRRLVRTVPPLHAVWQLVSAVNLGSLWRLVVRALPHESRAALDHAVGQGQQHRRLHGEVYRWQVLRWSQAVALGFQVGVAGTFALMVTLEDRAFAWSTQVEAVADAFPGLVHTLATPWGWALPEADPSTPFIERTRYVRFGEGSFETGDPELAELGRWWPFVMACLLIYGVLPRLLTWLYCVHRSRRATAWAVAHLPGSEAVLARLNGALIKTAIHDHAASSLDAEDPPALDAATPDQPQALINWAGAAEDGHAFGFQAVFVAPAGGACSVQDDQDAIRRAADSVRQGAATGVTVAVRAWEPPTLEVFDLVQALRAELGEGRAITLLAIVRDDESDGSAQWARHAGTVGDPWLKVVAGETSA